MKVAPKQWVLTEGNPESNRFWTDIELESDGAFFPVTKAGSFTFYV
jgi:hypothetical protein